MPIAFNCPSCKKKLSVKDEMAGKIAKCPCGVKLKIPQAPGSAGTPSQQQPAPQQQSAPQQQPAAQAQAANAKQSAAQQLAPLQQPAGQGDSGFESAFSDVPLGNPGDPLGNPSDPLGNPNDPLGGQAMGGVQPMAGAVPQAPGQPAPAAPAPDNLENINPDFKVQCIQCGQQFPMRPDLYGQTIQCKCGAPVRFDDPLGSAGTMINQDPLGLGAAMEPASDQPVAYQSLATEGSNKKQARAREDEVLKMYIKDDEEYEKATKPVKQKSSGGGGAVGQVMSGLVGVEQGEEEEGGVGTFIGGIIGCIALIGLGISMIIWPNLMREEGMTWSDAGNLKEMIVILIWGFVTGIIVCVLGVAATVAVIISPFASSGKKKKRKTA